ncbi:MAG TPA: NrfD/PsrC family molybdoenzyme membrane anchor subunit [bacterium]|nr:NrfD/PsrC family molybdoenzyme membrane anchor subunit [bacterium]
MSPTDLDVRQDEAPVLRPLQHSGPGFWVLIAGLLAVIGVGAYAYVSQLRVGLGVTGLNDRISWGIYITNFVFFIGVSHAGTLISAILRVTGAEWRRPITRMAEAITVFALLVGAPMVMIDMGRPERLLNVFRFGRLQSPILWDIISITTYVAGSLLYLYLPMIPDLAQLRDMPGLARWRRRLYGLLAVGWRGTPRQHAFLEQGIAAMAIVIIPVAISVHTVVSWIFGMTLRAGWHSTIFGPYFVIGAIFSGIAAIITAMGAFRRVYRLERFLTPDHFQKLGYLLLTLNLLYLYFTVSEYLTISYGAEIKDVRLIEALFQGTFSRMFWMMAVVGLILPAVLTLIPHLPVVDRLRRVPLLRPVPVGAAAVVMTVLAAGMHFGRGPQVSALWGISHDTVFAVAAFTAAGAVLALLPALRRRPVAAIVFASVLVNIGMWLKRYIIVVPSMALPLTRSEWATYNPTWVEWSITAAAFATFILLYALFAKFFPLISLWEVREAPKAAPAAAHGQEAAA